VSLGLAPEDWPDWLGRLKDGGLVGLEVYHPGQGPDLSAFFLSLARRFDLAPTAGSDFHGETKPAAPLGWTVKNSPLGREMLEDLRSRL